MICVVSDGRYHGRRICTEPVELIAAAFSTKSEVDRASVGDAASVPFREANCFPYSSACAQLWRVSDPPRMHSLRTAPRLVAIAKSLHRLRQTPLRDLRSCRRWQT